MHRKEEEEEGEDTTCLAEVEHGEKERERERGAATKIGEKRKESGRMEERRERESWEESPKNNAASASLPFEKNNLVICGICFVRRPSPLLSLARSLARCRGAKSETIKRGEICGVKRKTEVALRLILMQGKDLEIRQ